MEVLNNPQGNVEIDITLLRCVGWLSLDDISTHKGQVRLMGIATPDAQMLGKHAFDSIIPFGNQWRKSIYLAQAFNSPMKTVETKLHPGILSPKFGIINNSNKNYIIASS